MTTEQMRELDAGMAEKVMGWKRVKSYSEMKSGCVCIMPDGKVNIQERIIRSPYSPTTDAAQALEVLRGIGQEREIVIRFTCGAWFVTKTVFDSGVPDVRCQVTAPTLELAICLFAAELHQR